MVKAARNRRWLLRVVTSRTAAGSRAATRPARTISSSFSWSGRGAAFMVLLLSAWLARRKGTGVPAHSSRAVATDRRHQLAAQRRILLEIAKPAFGDHHGLALVDAPRAHAAVPRLDDDRNARGF